MLINSAVAEMLVRRDEAGGDGAKQGPRSARHTISGAVPLEHNFCMLLRAGERYKHHSNRFLNLRILASLGWDRGGTFQTRKPTLHRSARRFAFGRDVGHAARPRPNARCCFVDCNDGTGMPLQRRYVAVPLH